MKAWIFKNIILRFFYENIKAYIEPVKVSSQAIVLERSMQRMPKQVVNIAIATMRQHLINDIADYIAKEGFVTITEERMPTFPLGDMDLYLRGTVRVYKPLTRPQR